VKRRFLDIDKSKFDFLLERMDKHYSYDDLQVIVEEKKLLKEAPGVKDFTKALRYLSNVDNADMLLKAGIKSQDDVVELMNAATALKSISDGNFKQLGTFDVLDINTITRALQALGDNIPNVTKFTNEILESVEVAQAVSKAIKKRFTGGDTNSILELMLSKGDTLRNVDDLINQIKSVDQKFPGLIDEGLPATKKLKDAPGDVELIVLKNSIGPDGVPVRSLPWETQALLRKKVENYGVKEVEVPENINDGLKDPLPDGTGIVYAEDGSVVGTIPKESMPKKGWNKEFVVNGKKFRVTDIVNPLTAHKLWWNTIMQLRMPAKLGKYDVPLPLRVVINSGGHLVLLATLPIPQVVMAGILECAIRIGLGSGEELTVKDAVNGESQRVVKLSISDCITGMGYGDKFRNPMFFPILWAGIVPILGKIATRTGLAPGVFTNQGDTLLQKLNNGVEESFTKLYDQANIHKLLNTECTKEKMQEFIAKQNEVGKEFIKQFKPESQGFDVWTFLMGVALQNNPLDHPEVDAEAVYEYFGVANDSKNKMEKHWVDMQAYLPEHLKGDVNKFNTEAYVLYKCEVLRLKAIAKWLEVNERHLKTTMKDGAWNDCELVKFWKKLSTENGKVEEKSSKNILKNNEEQFMKIKGMIQNDPGVKLTVTDTVFDPKIWANVLSNWEYIELFENNPSKFENCKGVEYMKTEDEIDMDVTLEPGPTIEIKPEYIPPNYNWEYLTNVDETLACTKIKLGIATADYNYWTTQGDWYPMSEAERTWDNGVPSYPIVGQTGINLLSDPNYSSYCKKIKGGKTLAQCKASLTEFINTLSC
jgi:hypothetical protein